jgi:hypothetical protein
VSHDAASGLYTLSYDTPSGPATLRARSVAMTMPAWALADLVKAQAPGAAEALGGFDYPPVAAVTLAYPESSVRDDRKAADGSVPGFGQLHPRTQVRGAGRCCGAPPRRRGWQGCEKAGPGTARAAPSGLKCGGQSARV